MPKASLKIPSSVAIGDRFARWTVIALPERRRMASGAAKMYYRCRCDCGTVRLVCMYTLVRCISKSCGCLQAEITAARSQKHGHSPRSGKTPEYVVWRNMLSRCCDPKNHRFSDYGGRGIRVCDRWQRSDGFSNFIKDMGRKPGKRHTLDRKDNSGDYSPDNCRWATPIEQANNTRVSRFVRYHGRLITIADLAREVGMTYNKLYARIHACGWSAEAAAVP